MNRRQRQASVPAPGLARARAALSPTRPQCARRLAISRARFLALSCQAPRRWQASARAQRLLAPHCCRWRPLPVPARLCMARRRSPGGLSARCLPAARPAPCRNALLTRCRLQSPRRWGRTAQRASATRSAAPTLSWRARWRRGFSLPGRAPDCACRRSRRLRSAFSNRRWRRVRSVPRLAAGQTLRSNMSRPARSTRCRPGSRRSWAQRRRATRARARR